MTNRTSPYMCLRYQYIQMLSWIGFTVYPLIFFSPIQPFSKLFFFIMVRLLCDQDIPQFAKNRYSALIYRDITITHFDTTETPDREIPEVNLLIPHGIFCIEAGAVAHDFAKKHDVTDLVVFIDSIGLLTNPFLASFIKLIGCKDAYALKHQNIQNIMKDKKNIILFPGGFVEAIGCSEEQQYIFTKTYSYWIKQCKKHSYNLRIHNIYNGSDMYQGSSFMMKRRLRLASHGVPLPMVRTTNRVKELFVRTILYKVDNIPVTTQSIEEDLKHFLTKDRQHPDFPSRQKEYIITSSI